MTMNKTKLNINWSNVAAFMMPTLVFAAGCLFIAWMVQNMNTEARCKTVGGEMGYSKCYKNGKEI
jgi:hypothetical protein